LTAPVVACGTVRLVPFTRSHITPRYLGWLADRASLRYSEQRHRTHDADSAIAYMSQMTQEGYFWAIESERDGLGHVGNIAAYLDRPNACADLSILVGEPAARGLGVGRLAWCGAIDWLLSPAAGLRMVMAGTMSANLPMLALMRASGMRECGRIPGRFLLDGAECDMILAARRAESTSYVEN
jgi:RimJ/RimL family protein N-acetyltransferase